MTKEPELVYQLQFNQYGDPIFDHARDILGKGTTFQATSLKWKKLHDLNHAAHYFYDVRFFSYNHKYRQFRHLILDYERFASYLDYYDKTYYGKTFLGHQITNNWVFMLALYDYSILPFHILHKECPLWIDKRLFRRFLLKIGLYDRTRYEKYLISQFLQISLPDQVGFLDYYRFLQSKNIRFPIKKLFGNAIRIFYRHKKWIKITKSLDLHYTVCYFTDMKISRAKKLQYEHFFEHYAQQFRREY